MLKICITFSEQLVLPHFRNIGKTRLGRTTMISRDQIRVKFVCQAKLLELCLLGNNSYCRIANRKISWSYLFFRMIPSGMVWRINRKIVYLETEMSVRVHLRRHNDYLNQGNIHVDEKEKITPRIVKETVGRQNWDYYHKNQLPGVR